MLELFYTCVKCTLNTKNPLLPPQKSVKVDLIQENTGSFTTKKLLFSYEKYENAYVKRGVTVNPTIYDVSRLSGVSIATVSRAFSNPERVREDTRRKVFEAAEVLHYSPNAIARAMAIRPTSEMQGHISLIPQSLTIEHFISLFVSKGFGQAAINSLQTTLSSLVLSLIVGICAAYILARRRFRFGLKRPMTYWVLLVRVLPPVAFTIPLYTMFSKIGLLNTKIPVTLACVLINVPLIIWFLISFFQDLPEEVEESAKVDGATEWQLFRKIVLPLVAPGIAAVAMLSFMYAWNEYTYTVIFTRSPSNYTVPLALSVLNTEDNLTNFGLVAAGGVVSVIPITLFVIFAQNYLISGLSSGAVKE